MGPAFADALLFRTLLVETKRIKAKVGVKPILLGSVSEVADASLFILSVFEDGLIGNR